MNASKLIAALIALFVIVPLDAAQAVYNTGLGRWMTRDPLGYVDGPSLNIYVHNNPLLYIDQFGTEASISSNPPPPQGSTTLPAGPVPTLQPLCSDWEATYYPPNQNVPPEASGICCNSGTAPILIIPESGCTPGVWPCDANGMVPLAPYTCAPCDAFGGGCGPGRAYKVVGGCTFVITAPNQFLRCCSGLYTGIAQTIVKGGCVPIKDFYPQLPSPPPNPPAPRPPPPGSCFTGSTLVLTLAGAVPISSVKRDELVLGKTADGTLSYGRVKSVWTRANIPIYRLIITYEGNVEIIETTEDHPFWVEGSGWTAASRLRKGDRLQTFNPGLACVVSSTPTFDTAKVYNLTVTGTKTYFVGKSRIFTHNKPP